MTPSAENIILGLFALLPVVIGLLAIRFFRRADTERATVGAMLLGNGLILAGMVSVALLGGELYYRFVYDTTDSFGLRKTSNDWFVRHYHSNNAGVRDDIDYQMTPSLRPRIVFVGDSFTIGHGVENVADRFANIIRAQRPDLEVVLQARNGWETPNHTRAIADLAAARYPVDQVVLVYVLNDISDLLTDWRERLKVINAEARPGWLLANSSFLNTLYVYTIYLRYPELGDYYRHLSGAYKGAIWQQQAQRLRTLKQTTASAGAELLVVTFPFLNTLGPDDPYNPAKAQLAAFWKAEGVPYLDLSASFEGIPTDELVVGPRDAHPNPKAHAIAAQAINTFLLAHPPRKR